jgi:hypothetical protein
MMSGWPWKSGRAGQALGVMVHQIAGIYPDQARELYGISGEYEVVAAFAVGYPGIPEFLPERFENGSGATIAKTDCRFYVLQDIRAIRRQYPIQIMCGRKSSEGNYTTILRLLAISLVLRRPVLFAL